MPTHTRTQYQPTKVQNKFKIQNLEFKIFILRTLILQPFYKLKSEK